MARALILCVVLLLGNFWPSSAQGRGPREVLSADRPAVADELYDESGQPAVCYFCGRSHSEVHATYVTVMMMDIDGRRAAVIDRYDSQYARYSEQSQEWVRVLQEVDELPEIVIRMQMATIRSELENLAQEHPGLRDLVTYRHPHEQAPRVSTAGEYIAWLRTNPPQEPATVDRDYQLALLAEHEMGAMRRIESTRLLHDVSIGFDQLSVSGTDPYSVIDMLSRRERIAPLLAFDVMAALQRIRDALPEQPRGRAVTAADFEQAVQEVEISADQLPFVTMEWFQQMSRHRLPDLNEDRESALAEFRRRYGDFSAKVPICRICASRR